MTAPDASALEARLGHYYEADGPYLVGREKVREYARAVQDYHPPTGTSTPPRSWGIPGWSRR